MYAERKRVSFSGSSDGDAVIIKGLVKVSVVCISVSWDLVVCPQSVYIHVIYMLQYCVLTGKLHSSLNFSFHCLYKVK